MMQQLFAWIDAGNADLIVIATVAIVLTIETILKWRRR